MGYRRIRLAAVAAAAIVAPLLVMPHVPGEPGACPSGTGTSSLELGARGGGGACIQSRGPESGAERLAGLDQIASAKLAPDGTVPAGALRAALAQRAALRGIASGVAGAAGSWRPYGTGPLIANDARYTAVNGEGMVKLSGRVDSLDYDPARKRLFAALGTGGVWASDDMGAHWRSIGDNLPSQVNGALAWTPAGGGALILATGEPIQAFGARVGLGVYRTRDLGATWEHASGVPDGALGFQVAVDPKTPSTVYVATSKGLFRSTNAGASFANVRLPTGECAGKTDNGRCILANFVTDVVVQAPDTYGNAGGAVLAAVGYRSGARKFAGTELGEGEWNGLYSSPTGAPGTFTRLTATGFAASNRIGKVELGIAEGSSQNHDVVYALVEDAEMFRGGYQYVDAPTDTWTGLTNTVLNGVYVSKDFGASWTLMGDSTTIAQNPTTGSALTGTGQATFYAPGAQAWYNQWIKPDPTRQTAEGIPTRLTFGLEEIWENDLPDQAADKPTGFHVIGKYFADRVCLFVDTGLPACPTGRPPIVPTTTHPDQHEGLFVPDGSGGVTLVAGNDGGVYVQHVDASSDFDNTRWGDGANDGFNTLLPYHARMAKDGTVWFGLQDNGSGKIDPADGKIYETVGGDGFFAAVDPNNSDYAWTETPSGSMRVTTDGGVTWKSSAPSITGAQFSNPFVMDPTDSNHLMTAGREVVETVDGASTCSGSLPDPLGVGLILLNDPTTECTWTEVFNLGTKLSPGNATAEVAETGDAANTISAVDLYRDSAYVGFCGPCSIMNDDVGFGSGLATNVGGAAAPLRMTSNGWHIARARGLPNRTITSIAIDPVTPSTVYVTLGGYDRGWRPPGSFRDKNTNVGRGHVFKSTDAGATFKDVSGSLPNVPANWVTLRGSQIVVATEIGVFLSTDANGSSWAALDAGMPAVPVSSLQVAPGNPNLLLASTFGRGFWVYEFPTAARPAVSKKPTSVLGSRTSRAPLPATGVADQAGLVLLAMAALVALVTRRVARAR